jgi:8-hydroxy-5-deazaflavin:NADPH oxidoreductase
VSSVQVGILGGTGPAGRGLAARFASVGLDVVIGSRSADRAQEICNDVKQRWPGRELALSAADNTGAAAADVVIVATPWEGAAPTVASVADLLVGKVVICMANALAKVGDEFQPLISPRGSVAQAVQAKLPRSFVAAAFQHLPARELADLEHELGADVLVCSDHPDATETTIGLIGKIPGLRGLDAGSLGNAGSLESFVAVLLEVNIRYKAHASIRITGVG